MNLKAFLLTSLLLVSCTFVARAVPIIYGNGQEIAKVMDLPHEDDYTVIAENGKAYHANLGILHSQFSLFWLPLFNYGSEIYVLYTDQKIGNNDYTYYPLDRGDIAYLQSIYPDLPSTPKLPFWDRWGGKLVLLLIIGVLIFFGSLSGKDKDKDSVTDN